MFLNLVKGDLKLDQPTSISFCSYDVYDLTKADEGLNTKQLVRLFELLNYAQLTMQSPTMAHIKIEQPTKRMTEIGKILTNYADKYRLGKPDSRPLYALKYEEGSITKREHCHLYIIVDDWVRDDLIGLAKELERTGVSGAIRSKNCKPVALMNRSREFVPIRGSTAYHRLNEEAEDAFKRISYIAKIKTTSKLRRKSFSASALPKDCSVLADIKQLGLAA